jgi:hypothetical protein
VTWSPEKVSHQLRTPLLQGRRTKENTVTSKRTWTTDKTLQRLARSALFALVRGAATAAGTTLFAAFAWWLSNR